MVQALPTRAAGGKLALGRLAALHAGMWQEPYLETCCRAALHRLSLAGGIGRDEGGVDGPCLARLSTMGLACRRPDGRFEATALGVSRHASEILRGRAPQL